jgi:hypothetical protein
MTSIAFVGASVPLCADIPVRKMMVRYLLCSVSDGLGPL